METRRRITAGVFFWTPAPVRTSRTSSVISEDVWEDEDEEQAEKEDDFVSQMDENGIIGLSEALEAVESGETCGDANAEFNPNLYPGPFTPEEADLSGHETYTPSEELSYSRSECLSPNKSPGDDVQILSPCESEGETKKVSSTQSCNAHPLAMEPAGVSNHHCPISQLASPVTALTFPHLLHFTAEELAATPGIEAETFPEISFTESLPESHRSHRSLKSSPRCPEVKLRAPLQSAAMFSEEVMSNHHSRVSNGPLKGTLKSDKHQKPTPSPRKMRQHSTTLSTVEVDSLKCKHQTTSPERVPRTPRARSNVEVDESRKAPLSYRTPDFSKVEPKVRFPKGGYKPPKSRRSSKRESLSPGPPLVFKSPADIVKEVLLNVNDGSPAPSDPYRPPASTPDFTVPQEFRCPRHATTLLEQLQEDYNTLLTKYAEAENTIDRLRLEAKMNLYSDPPKPGHLVQSGLNQGASGLLRLDFSQAQRAEISSDSLHPNGHDTHQRSSPACPSSTSPGPQVGQQPAKILYNQADRFLQQLQTFEDLLKGGKLKPFEQMKGVAQLAEGLDSLERGYLFARDENKLLQQRGAELSHFDPDR